MHYILYLVLEGFFVQIKAPDKPGPVAITRDSLVLDVNADARQRGIVPGMEKRTARAVAHETTFYVWEEDTYEEAQTKWLDLCTEFTGIIEPEEQNSAYLDLSAHPNPLDVSEKLVRTLVRETGLRVFYGPSFSKWIARLASKRGDCGTAAIDPAKFLAPLSVFDLTPVSLENRQRLNFLGYRTIGDILTIPDEILRQQFGTEGLFISKAARGDFGDHVFSIYPRDSIIETLIFDGAVDSTETIDYALKDLSTRIATRLSQKSLQGQEVTLNVEFENGASKQLTRRFSKAIHNLPSALAALHILFDQLVNATQKSSRAITSDQDPSPATTSAQNPSPAAASDQDPSPATTYAPRCEVGGAPRSGLGVSSRGWGRSVSEISTDQQKPEIQRTGRGCLSQSAIGNSRVSGIPDERESATSGRQLAIGNQQSAIASLRITLTNLKSRKEKQTALLGQSKTDSASAVNVVRTVFGDTSVQLGAEIPIPRRVKVLREWKNATGWS